MEQATQTMSHLIATSLCVDVDPHGAKVDYPQVAHVSPSEREEVYWRCAVVFFATSVPLNPDCRHVLVTNAKTDASDRSSQYREALQGLGVEVAYVPFKQFLPPVDASRTFRNNFYKFEAIRFLSTLIDHEDLLVFSDSDCVWLRPVHDLTRDREDHLQLYLAFASPAPEVVPSGGISREQMGEVFSLVNTEYPEPAPLWIGGEFVAGPGKLVQSLMVDIEASFDAFVEFNRSNALSMPNGSGMLENDEFVLSYVVNRRSGWVSVNDRIRRIWTGDGGAKRMGDLGLCLWHLPNEKKTGFLALYQDIELIGAAVAESPDTFPSWLGGYLGVPERQVEARLSLSGRMRRSAIAFARSALPLPLYNLARALRGLPPID